LEATGACQSIDTRTDKSGRKQPARKPAHITAAVERAVASSEANRRRQTPAGNDVDPAQTADRRKAAAQTDLEDFTPKGAMNAAAQRAADDREAAVRAEYAGRLFMEPDELENAIAKELEPLREALADREAELAKFRDREKARRRKAKEHLEAHAEEHLASSKQSLQSTAITLVLHELYDAVAQLTPAKVIETELSLAEVIGQTKTARLGPALAHAKQVRTWLDQFIETGKIASDPAEPQPAAPAAAEAAPGADLSSADDGIPPLLRRSRTTGAANG
jgi:hypothetical protein